MMNYIVGAVLAFVSSPHMPSLSYILNAPWFWSAIIVGIMFSLSFAVYGLSAQRSGVAITTISGRAAVVIPVVFAFAVLGAEVTFLKVAMLVLILLAMVLILKRSDQQGRSPASKWVLLLPIIVFLFNGANDTVVQYAQNKLVPANEYMVYTGVMFLAGAVTGAVMLALDTKRVPRGGNMAGLLWGSLLGFMNWVCMIGVFNGLDYVDGSVFYPLYYTGAIVISTIVGVLVFKEKLSKLNYVGILIAIAAIAVLSTL